MYDTFQSNCLLNQVKRKSNKKNISHKKIWRTGAEKIQVDPPPIPFTKVRIIQTRKQNVWKLDFIELLRQKSQTYTNLKWTFLIMANQRSSCYSCGTSKWRLMHQALSQPTRISIIYVKYHVQKHYVSVIPCVLRREVQPWHI